MRKRLDLTGQRFGRLVAIRDNGTRTTNRSIVWLCKCKCGKTVSVDSRSLRRGNTRSCGCLHRDIASKPRRRIDLTGQRFGRLIVSRCVSDKSPYKWECRCTCGNVINALGSHLIIGRTKSCGCIKREWRSHANCLMGQRFGRLVVTRQVGSTACGHVAWECQCDCGIIKEVAGASLRDGSTRSCGCLRSERLANIHRKNKELNLFLTMGAINDEVSK